MATVADLICRATVEQMCNQAGLPLLANVQFTIPISDKIVAEVAAARQKVPDRSQLCFLAELSIDDQPPSSRADLRAGNETSVKQHVDALTSYLAENTEPFDVSKIIVPLLNITFALNDSINQYPCFVSARAYSAVLKEILELKTLALGIFERWGYNEPGETFMKRIHVDLEHIRIIEGEKAD